MNNEDKNIYDMLNDIDIDLDEYEKEDFTDIEKMKLKKQSRKYTRKKDYKKYITAASVLLISLGILTQTKIGAYAYSAIIDISESIKIGLGVDDKISEYTTNVNQSITKRGLTVKIDDVILDDNELIIALSHEYKGELKKGEKIYLTSERLSINGKEVNGGNVGYYSGFEENKENHVTGYKLDKNYEDNIDVKLRIMNARVEDENGKLVKKIIGPWTFKFIINSQKLDKDSVQVDLDNQAIKLTSGDTMYLEKYRGNIINQKIYTRIETTNKDINNNTDSMHVYYILKGRDDLGNKLTFKIKNGSSREDFIFEFDKENNKFNENAKALYLTPYIEHYEYHKDITKTTYEKIADEFTIKLKS